MNCMDDNDDDSHLCLRCSSTITGLENYILHRKAHCAPTKQAPAGPQITSPSATQHYEPSSLRADDFFSSLELQSTQAVVTTSAAAHKSAQADDDFDDAEDSENELYPPRSHTGGKWKPGWRPDSGLWKSIQSPAKQTHNDPSKLDDSNFYCAPCDRSYRDRYSFGRHVTTPYHLKRSGETRAPCKRSSRTRSSCKLSGIIDRLLDKGWPKEVERELCRTSKNECPTLRASHVGTNQKIGSSESHVFTCRVVDHNSYVHCVNPAEVTGQACRPKEIRPALKVLKNGDVRSGPRHCSAASKHHRKNPEHQACEKGAEDQKDMYRQQEQREVGPAPNVPPLPQADITSNIDLEEYELHGIGAVMATAETCQKSSSSTAKVSCPYCSKLVNKLYLKFHLFTHTGERPYQCHMCGRTFSHRSTLSTHLKHHLGIKRYQCNRCTFRAVRPSMLRRHQRSIHDTDLGCQAHLCHISGSAHFDLQSVRPHISQHESIFRFACEVPGCGKSFTDLSRVKAHSRVHESNRNLLCDTCGYSTTSTHQLTKHKRRHTGERPFKCEHCNYDASRCSQLRRHSRVHTGAKPYQCPYCNYKCNSQENMRKHILRTKKHSGKKMYECSKCTFSSNKHSAYKDHLQNEHNTQRPPSGSQVAEVMSSAAAGKKSFNRRQEFVDGKNEEMEILDNRDTLKLKMPQMPCQGLPASTCSFELARFCTSLDLMARHETADLSPPRSAVNPHTARADVLLAADVLPNRTPPPDRLKHRNHVKKRPGITEGNQSDMAKMPSPLKTTYSSNTQKENSVSYISSADSVSLASPIDAESLVNCVTSKTYGINAMPASVDRSISGEHTDCILLPDLHEQPAMLPSDQIGLAHVDGNNTVYIYMPLNGP